MAKLGETSVESRRPLYTNLIQFAELHPTKIKVGVIAPTQGQYKATGTERVPGAESDFQFFEGEPGKVIDLVRCGGSTSVTNGARVTEVEEPVLEARPVFFEFEVDEVAESKALLSWDLQELVLRHGSPSKAASKIGTSESFIRLNAKSSKQNTKKN